MTENDIKLLFRSMKKLKARRDNLECMKRMDSEYDHICKMLYMMENSLQILNENEREIIWTHLVEGTTWEQVIIQYEKRHGRQNGYSKRTFERIQQRALKRLLEVIENSEIENLLQNFDRKELYDTNLSYN